MPPAQVPECPAPRGGGAGLRVPGRARPGIRACSHARGGPGARGEGAVAAHRVGGRLRAWSSHRAAGCRCRCRCRYRPPGDGRTRWAHGTRVLRGTAPVPRRQGARPGAPRCGRGPRRQGRSGVVRARVRGPAGGCPARRSPVPQGRHRRRSGSVRGCPAAGPVRRAQGPRPAPCGAAVRAADGTGHLPVPARSGGSVRPGPRAVHPARSGPAQPVGRPTPPRITPRPEPQPIP